MRSKLEGFDPFYNGWKAWEENGLPGVEAIEAPLVLVDFSRIDPDLAYRAATTQTGLIAEDFRFGVWPDAFPVPVRALGEPVGVHLNTFSGRQIRYGAASDVERAVLDELTHQTEELVRDAINPANGAAWFQFGKIPTMHRHVVGREMPDDGLVNWKERTIVELVIRQQMRDRVTPVLTELRERHIIEAMTKALERTV